MGNPFSSKDFKRLQDSWYGKLAEQGFEDIEHTNIPSSACKRWSFKIASKYNPETEAYFRKACEFLNYYNFEKILDREIWILHAEGFSLRQITKKLNSKVYICHRVVSKLKKVMLNGG